MMRSRDFRAEEDRIHRAIDRHYAPLDASPADVVEQPRTPSAWKFSDVVRFGGIVRDVAALALFRPWFGMGVR